jgi:hypothetical protein
MTGLIQESRRRVFCDFQHWQWLISIPDRDSIPMFERSPDEVCRLSTGYGCALQTVIVAHPDVNGKQKHMEGNTFEFGRFRVLDCYCRRNVGTFTTHAGRLETLKNGSDRLFVASQEFEVDRCHEPIRAEPTTTPDFGYALLIHKALPIKEVNE